MILWAPCTMLELAASWRKILSRCSCERSHSKVVVKCLDLSSTLEEPTQLTLVP